MRIVYVTDRLSVRGGADLHLRQVITWAVASGHDVSLAVGRLEKGVQAPSGVATTIIRGLASATESTARLGGLDEPLAEADLVHAQNLMNPAVLQRITATGKAVVTVQDHRVFCPGMGKTMPDGLRCEAILERADCSRCLPDEAYRSASIELTRARRNALRGARLIVLSTYMKSELEAEGLDETVVIPPWVVPGPKRTTAGAAFLLGGRLVAHKGVSCAHAAWQCAGRPLPLEVAGEGPLASTLPDAHHLGWLGHAELTDRLRRARAVLFPAFWQEPFGILGIEALAQGTPVIVAAAGGTADWSDRGCLSVAPGDVNAMAGAIRRLSHDPGLAARMGEEGRLMVAERFSRDRLVLKLEAVYRDAGGFGLSA